MNAEMLRELIRLGADVSQKNQHGNTALHMALMVGDQIPKNKEIIKILNNAKAYEHITNNYG